MDPKERDGPKENGQTLVTRLTLLGTTPHGKTYGVEVDPWTAVEPVLCLCAVSLNSSCEDFSELTRMSSGTHTPKLRSLRVKRVSVALQVTRQGFSVNNGDTLVNEMMDALQP